VRNPIDKEIPGIVQLVEKAEVRIRNGLVAYDALEKLKANRGDDAARASFNASSKDLGYGLLLKQFVEDPRLANDQQIKDAAWFVAPQAPWLFLLFPPHGGLRFRAACSVRDLALAHGARRKRRVDGVWQGRPVTQVGERGGADRAPEDERRRPSE